MCDSQYDGWAQKSYTPGFYMDTSIQRQVHRQSTPHSPTASYDHSAYPTNGHIMDPAGANSMKLPVFLPKVRGNKRGRKPSKAFATDYELLQRQKASIKERKRAVKMKTALEKLKDCLPAHFHTCYRPMSKVKTLKLATSYIAALGTLIGCQCEAHKGESVHLYKALGLGGESSESCAQLHNHRAVMDTDALENLQHAMTGGSRKGQTKGHLSDYDSADSGAS